MSEAPHGTWNQAGIKRLRWRCRRGMLELDQLLTRWIDARADSGTVDDFDNFARLLECEDDLLWSWFMQRAPVSDPHLSDLSDEILALPPR